MLTTLRLVAIGGLAIAVTVCGGGSGGGVTNPPAGCTPGNGTVCLTTGNTFNPSTVTVARGTSVTWDNATGVTHNVTFDAVTGAPVSASNFSSGTFVATFTAAGTYPYHCTIHGLSMSGTVVVQ